MDEKTRPIRTYIVDAFTDMPFKGNPAGVCLLDGEMPVSTMLDIAVELNFSETAFVQKDLGENSYTIRYFSPKKEIPLCGHATLAASSILVDNLGISALHFTTIEGLGLNIKKKGQQIEMEFPVYKTGPAEVPQAMLVALGLDGVTHSVYNAETNILVLEVATPQTVEGLSPNYAKLLQSHDSIGGVIVMSRGEDPYDFVYRHFWPWNGTNEDPVTGAVHSFLAPYWAERLGKNSFKAFQPSERTGSMEVELVYNEKVLIRGKAVCVFEGHMLV